MPRLPTRLAVSMHEAGHAIVQLVTGPSPGIEYIAVNDRSDDELGRVETVSMWQPSYMESAHAPAEVVEDWKRLAGRDVVNYLAGPIAELRWRRHCRATIWFAGPEMAERCLGGTAPGADTDFGRVRRRLRWARPGREREAFREAWLETEEIVARWWRVIQVLGRELDDRGRLEEVELLEIWSSMSELHGRTADVMA